MTALEVRPVDRGQWDGFLAQGPPHLLFHSSLWLDLLSRVYGREWHPLGLWEKDRLLGLFPVQTRRLGPFKLAGSPLMQVIASTPFLGGVIEPHWLEPALAALEKTWREWKIDHLEIAFPYLLEENGWAERLGYGIETCRTVRVPLGERSPDRLWSALSSACRRAVRKAEREGVEIVEARDAGFLDEYYAMCLEVYRRAGRLPHLSGEFYRAAWEALSERGLIKVLLARRNGRLLAGGIFLLYGDTVYYLSGASADRAQGVRPNNLIQWRLIQWAAAHHFRTYDMGGAVVPGITRFKMSFGGEFYAYTRLYRANSAAARIGRGVYRRAIPLWRKWIKVLKEYRPGNTGKGAGQAGSPNPAH